MAYADEVLADAPNAYWKLADFTDSSGNGLTLTAAGTTAANSLVPSEPGSSQAKDFDGTDDDLQRADTALLNPTTAITLEAWVRPDVVSAGGERPVFRKGSDYGFIIHDTLPSFRWEHNGSVQKHTTAITAGVVYHVAFTYDGANVRAYLDGAENGSPQAATGSINDGAAALILGFLTGFTRFDGVMQHAAIYPTALSSTRIATHYDVGVNGDVPPVIDPDYSRFPPVRG